MYKIKLHDVCRAFKIYPSQVYQLEARGTLPERPARTITPEWVVRLAEWHAKARGKLPPIAHEMLVDALTSATNELVTCETEGHG